MICPGDLVHASFGVDMDVYRDDPDRQRGFAKRVDAGVPFLVICVTPGDAWVLSHAIAGWARLVDLEVIE